MTIRKRFRVLYAVLTQRWHTQTCGECGFQWPAVGPERPELIRICDQCELKQLNQMFEHAEREYQSIIGEERR